jgi:hypothetical protein
MCVHVKAQLQTCAACRVDAISCRWLIYSAVVVICCCISRLQILDGVRPFLPHKQQDHNTFSLCQYYRQGNTDADLTCALADAFVVDVATC